MATLAGRLNELRWIFYEKGITNVWNELKRLSDADNNAQLALNADFGTIDYTTNCVPDVAQTSADESRGRRGNGDNTYPDKQFPPRFAGFES